MISGDGWVAVLLKNDPGYPIPATPADPNILQTPVVFWQQNCNDLTLYEGWILQDRDGNDLPYPVPAPNVFGFLRYEKTS